MGKGITFFGFVWLLTCLAGSVLAGQVSGASTQLTANINSTATTITVSSTNGFPAPGILIIEDERITYSSKTSTTFTGNAARPLVRGSSDTTAVAHTAGTGVRTPESALVNSAVDYDLAVISDATGMMAFIQMPVAVFDILKTFIILPISFLGTDLAIITVFWGVMMLGLIISIIVAMAGGRRV